MEAEERSGGLEGLVHHSVGWCGLWVWVRVRVRGVFEVRGYGSKWGKSIIRKFWLRGCVLVSSDPQQPTTPSYGSVLSLIQREWLISWIPGILYDSFQQYDYESF